jgi:pimeloyl-ACP methyl ester carboxylesterase
MITKQTFNLTGYNDKPILADMTLDINKRSLNIVLFIHGFKGFKDWGAHNLAANYFATHNFTYLKFNFSHSGVPANAPTDVTDLDLFASNTVSTELYDLNVVLEYIEKEFGANAKIYLIGHSRGGGLSILKTANDNRINKLITWSAINDFSSLWKKEQEEEWLKTGQIYVTNARTKEQMPLKSSLLTDFNNHKTEYNILSAATKIKIPWLIIQGTDDINVPLTVAQKLHETNPKSKLLEIVGANHVYGVNHPYLEKELPPQLQKVCDACISFLNKNE